MADSFEEFRPRILEYLQDKGINPRKRFRCLNPAHLDRNPSMGYDPKRHKVHCFACGADYDLFDLLAIDEGLSSPGEALAEAARQGVLAGLPREEAAAILAAAYDKKEGVTEG